METLKSYIIIGLFIIICVIILLKGCSNPFPNLNVTPEPKVIIHSDTIFSRDTLVKFKTIISPRYDTIIKLDSFNKEVLIDKLPFIRIYNDSLIDSTQTIYSRVKVIGILSTLDLSYKLHKHPILITNNIIETKIERKNPSLSIYTGLTLGGNKSSFNLSPFINFNIKNSSIGYSYGILNQTHNISVGIKIFNSKK